MVLVELGDEELIAGELLLVEVGAVDVVGPASLPSLEHAASTRGMTVRIGSRRFMIGFLSF